MTSKLHPTMPSLLVLRDVLYRVSGISRLEREVEAAGARLDGAIADGIVDHNAQFAITVSQTLRRYDIH